MTPEEFRKMVLPEGRRLYALAFRYLNSREEAEDAVQEVMIKLWSERNGTANYSSVGAWCTTVTRNCCIDILRRRKRMRIGDLGEAEKFTAPDADTGNKHDAGEAARLVSDIVNRMKEPGKSAVILRDIEGYSYEETAEAMGMNVTTLRTLMSRARKQIREEMERIYSYGTGKDKGTAL
ncbi:MAG: RNA polymerase sigma factor [Bacteroidota bacterium]|jgi:RNA polymerase sigma-70 factor (ECF subfamily)|nr:RNA polymerase sigma factor [Bacteroidota bacterium]